MKKCVYVLLASICILLSFQSGFAQTSWKGTVSTNWTTAGNWTAGIPNANIDAIIGDANFTGANQPTVNAGSACKSLTIGGTVSSTLTLSRNLTVSGAITINSNGTVNQPKSTLAVTGNWVNNGTYSSTNNNAKVNFSGVSQTLGGSSTTTFRKLIINAGSVVTLNAGFTVGGAGSSLTVNGTLNPGSASTYLVTAGTIQVNSGGKLMVYASTFAGNYSSTPTLAAGSIVEYASSSIAQTVSNAPTYATLTISGSTVKTLQGNLPSLLSSAAAEGNVYVNAGTLDLSTFTANRGTSVAGGTFRVYNGAILKIGGTNTFPSNYASRILQLTSTVQYSGTSQTILSETYGSLLLTSSSGAAVKTMPATAFTVEGNFSSSIGSGTSVSYTAAAAITVRGSMTIGSGTTFNGSSFSHTLEGNWINDGTFTGATSTIVMSGVQAILSGAGVYNINNLTSSASGITASASTLSISGNLLTSGPGQFTHSNSSGTITMSGAAKTISGTGISFANLTISGTVTSSSSFVVAGNLAVGGSFSASAGTVTMSGSSKTISGTGTVSFYNFTPSGSISTAINFTIASSVDVSGNFTATAGTATFIGTSSLNGTANLFNVTINGTSLSLSSNAVLGIASTFAITSGTLNVTGSSPNTVNYNGSGAQNILGTTYDNLVLSNGNIKTSGSAFVVNRDITISASTTFNAASHGHTVKGNWVNNGAFTASTSSIFFTGSTDGSVSGNNTFNILTVNKSSSANILTLNNDISATVVNMLNGGIRSGSNTITITSSRTGPGIILGNIKRTQGFVTGTPYAFEGPDNLITFTGSSSVTSVTVSVTTGNISDFPFNASINRQYTVSVTGTYSAATVRLHYEDNELNGNSESSMQLWKYNGSAWVSSGKTSNNSTTNYIEQTGLTPITNRWTTSDNPNVLRWNGSVSSDWNTAANWTNVQGTPGSTPAATDVVQIGTAAFTNQPSINNSAAAKNIIFGSTQAATLSLLSGSSLTVNGNISGTWTSDASHTINVNNQSLVVNGDITLTDGTVNHLINLNADAGTVTTNGALTQGGGAAITFTGAGTLNIAGNFNYTTGTFSNNGTVVYNGSAAQAVAPVSYNNVTINKASGIASINSAANIAGNLLVSSGELDNFSTTTINGNVTVSSGATLKNYLSIYSKGDWTIAGTFTPSGSNLYFNGTADQYISASSFDNLIINKASGKAILTGNATVTSNVSIIAGTLDLQTYSCNRVALGGSVTVSDGASLLVAGASNFPANYNVYTLGSTSTVSYYGTVAQSVAGISYGNLGFSNGGANAKTLAASAIVKGNITVDNGATFHSGGYTSELYGNWTNNGTFTPSTGTIILQGTSKTITGNIVFNKLTVNGSYTVGGTDITCNGLFNVTSSGTFNAGSGTSTVNGDLTNSGTLFSSGTTTFTGTVVQTLRLINAISSTSTGIVNFNGNVSPILNSTSSPTFAILNINNTVGINPSAPWQVTTAMNVNSGGIFNGGVSNHYIYGNFTNAGTVTSSGHIFFTGTAAKTINFGSTGFTSVGHVLFSGSGQITISGTPGSMKDVTISNTHSAGVTPSSNWNINGNFVINSNSIFHASTYSHTVAGNIESNGTLDGGSSTFTMTSATGELEGSPTTTFNHFVITGTVMALSDFNVSGNYTNNGVYDGTAAIMIMTGSNAASINGSTTPSSLSQLEVAKSGNAVVTMNVNLSDVALLYIQSGILTTSTYSITQDAGGGFLLIDSDATLRLGGGNSLPGFSGYGLDANSNVDYAGSLTQAIGNAAIYGNLLITGSGMKNAIVPFITQGNFTLTNGNLTSAVSVTHTIGGNWLMTGGTFSNTNIAIVMNGTVNQDISSTGAFKNLQINKASGLITLSSNVTVNGILNLTSGKVSINNSNLIIANTGSISNANATNYIIAAGSGTLTQQVLAGGNKVFPVGLTAAYTPATIALTGASTTDIFNIRMLDALYIGGTSGTQVTNGAVNATWMISENVIGGSDASVTLQWPSSLEMPGFNRTTSRLAHYTSSAWECGPADIAASGSNPYFVTRAGFTDFSPFAVSTFIALPVNWVSISGRNEGKNNVINWIVASEKNNALYVIEASTTGTGFMEVGRMNGAGTTNLQQQYSFTHYNVSQPQYYYRIKQVDIDGHFTYSKVVKVETGNAMQSDTKVVSNPVYNSLVISTFARQSFNGLIHITDATGRLIFKGNKAISAGNNIIDLGSFNQAAGIYYLIFTGYHGEKKVVEFIKK